MCMISSISFVTDERTKRLSEVLMYNVEGDTILEMPGTIQVHCNLFPALQTTLPNHYWQVDSDSTASVVGEMCQLQASYG